MSMPILWIEYFEWRRRALFCSTLSEVNYIYNYVCIILNQLAIEHANKSQVNSIVGVFKKTNICGETIGSRGGIA
jgi:hypothetical protein